MSKDYGIRIYDPRVERFLSVEPIAKKFPELTPYQFAGNNPIKYIDFEWFGACE
jgi:RHS repeat-associated protein